MSKPLANKVALVTGGSRGMGAAIALRLARDGADVVISYSASGDKADAVARQITALGVRGVAIQADQGDPAQVAALVQQVGEQFGRIDILVNNAGILMAGLVSDPVDPAAIERLFAINVLGVATAVRAAIALMPDHGRIINMGSGLGERAAWAGTGDYSATKAAVNLYSRSWARELAPRGITVNVVQPGPVATDMNPDSGDFADMERKLVPLGRFGTTDELAAAVAFLASPDASYITGVALNVDGGMSA
ncbi:SDR family oxidoreductase [Rugamonas sp.]|uniref:SDR family NAD(P)-dependent oxidoreductase n=1 Tax=Rugamonas sp. TaxID=1926287 RepID=UPI0025F0DF56|nr:SDR family oxidoreductase [Rugamonas sp.]